jgi:GT2 family glycosyltransferase
LSDVSLPRVEDPLVSVVMVLYGRWELALRAIGDLAANTDPCFELVLIDNASPDDTPDRIEQRVEGATIVRNEVNRGFGGASNQGAELARGQVVCLLNSDALVEPGWLPPLLETLAEPGVGAVVPLLLNEDGTVQEAGSVVDSIGHPHAVGGGGHVFGGGGSASDFQYRFRREVDFGSAACMLVRRELFLELGGFDETYSPGYFEDTDFCFRLHERGLRTIYEPRSRVVHVRHGSGTADTARLLQLRHRDLFVERWGERLLRRPRLVDVPYQPSQMLAARDAEALDRILVIDDRVPYTDRGSGDPRMARLLAELAALWPSARITLAAADGDEAERYAEPLLRQGIEVVCAPVDWLEWFRERRFHYGTVIVSRWQNVVRFDPYLRLTQPQALRVFDTEAFTFRRLERQAELLPDGRGRREAQAEAVKARETELRAVQEADVVFCVSDEEARLIEEVSPGKRAFCLTSVVEPLDEAPGFEERENLVFYGGFLAGAGSPNEDSLLFLVNDVLPLFWEAQPDVVLNVIGADVTDAARALESPLVRIVGYVDDPVPWLAQARLHVNPMRFGAGVKLKFLDSLAAGLPFVTTAVGAEGIALGDLRPLLVAEDPRGLAEAMARLYTDRADWSRAQARLLELARRRFDRASFQRTLIEAMSHVGVAPPMTVRG